MTIPDEIRALLCGPCGLDRSAAYLQLDKHNTLLKAGGRLDLFFDSPPLVGGKNLDWAWLIGLEDHQDARSVELSEGRWADVYARPTDANSNGRWVLLVQATEPLRKVRSILQLNQELTLASSEGRLLGDALRIVDAVVLRPVADGRFRLVGPATEWFSAVFGADVRRPVDISSTWTFVTSFLPDAEALWNENGAGAVRSEIFMESGDDAEDMPLEATALRTTEGDRLFVLQRITERFTTQQQVLQQARDLSIQHETLAAEIEKKEVLLHCIVHDLSSPLSAIIACLEMVENVFDARPELAQMVQIALRQARRQSSMIDQVLDVFRADLQRVTHFVPPGDAPDLVRVAHHQIEALLPVARLHGVSLRLAAPDTITVSATEDQLGRVLANLIDNAIRHAPRGTEVEVGIQATARFVRTEVNDAGTGVPPRAVPDLFQKLSQGEGRRGKAGLGLFFCRLMTERWGGRIGYEPQNPGACFWFELPIIELPAGSDPRE